MGWGARSLESCRFFYFIIYVGLFVLVCTGFFVRYFFVEGKSLPAHEHGELGHWWL